MCLTKAAPRRAGRHDVGDVNWALMGRMDDQQVTVKSSLSAITLPGNFQDTFWYFYRS